MADASGEFSVDIDDEVLRALEKRLNEAIAKPYKQSGHHHLEKGLSAKYSVQNASSSPAFARNSSPEQTTEQSASQNEPGEGVAMDFLAELEQEVAAKNLATSPQESRAKNRQLHEALLRIFSFLHNMTRHANQLQSEISRSYYLDSQAIFKGLRWQDAFADCRKQSLSENSLLSSVSFRLRIVAEDPVCITRRWDQLKTLKDDLHILNLRLVDDSVFSKTPEQEYINLQLAADIPLQISFQGNYKLHQIDVVSRNFEAFCISAFVIDIEQVDQTFLDELGRFLLSRRSELPDALRRVNYVSPVANGVVA